MQAKLASQNVSRETEILLTAYAELVRKWTRKINLVSASQLDDLWSRHILDSLQIVNQIPTDATSVTDLGSGGGFPGLVIAIDARTQSPERMVNLVESDQRKAVFLRTVIRELGLNAKVSACRIEEADLSRADVVTARALASLDHLLTLSQPFLKEDGVAIFPKGKSASEELQTARQQWQFSCQEVESLTDIDARILVIRNMRRGTSRG